VRQRKEPAAAEPEPKPEPRGPEQELVRRLNAVIAAFTLDQQVARALVQVEFNDGTRFALHSISPEPGLGFVTIMPHPEDLPDAPGAIVVPVGSIRRIELDRAEEERGHLGFTTLGE
jgi:hypothetical protein